MSEVSETELKILKAGAVILFIFMVFYLAAVANTINRLMQDPPVTHFVSDEDRGVTINSSNLPSVVYSDSPSCGVYWDANVGRWVSLNGEYCILEKICGVLSEPSNPRNLIFEEEPESDLYFQYCCVREGCFNEGEEPTFCDSMGYSVPRCRSGNTPFIVDENRGTGWVSRKWSCVEEVVEK